VKKLQPKVSQESTYSNDAVTLYSKERLTKREALKGRSDRRTVHGADLSSMLRPVKWHGKLHFSHSLDCNCIANGDWLREKRRHLPSSLQVLLLTHKLESSAPRYRTES